MRIRTTTAAITAVLAISLVGCSSDDSPSPGTTTAKPTVKPPTPSPSSTVAPPSPTPTPTIASGQPLGTSVQTDGDAAGGGVLEITPTSVIYLAKTFSDKPANGQFLVVTVKDKAMTAAPASETAPMGGGGWTYIAPDGQAISTLSGNATSVVPDGFEGGGAVEPGTFQWSSNAFDISPKQAGGTILYKDGSGKSTRWKVPATTTGPEAAKVQASLK